MEQSSPTPSLDLTVSSHPAKEAGVLSCSGLSGFEIWLKYTDAIYVQGHRGSGGREARGKLGIMPALSFHLEMGFHLRNAPVLIPRRTLCLVYVGVHLPTRMHEEAVEIGWWFLQQR